MYVTDQQKLAKARELASTLDQMSRSPKRVYPTAPWIIPATMIVVALFAIVCLVVKLLMIYMRSKKSTQKKSFRLSEASSPDIPTTPEDQASMATTASMKTRGSLGINSKRRSRVRPPAVSLYQMKKQQSPGSSSSKNRAMKALVKATPSQSSRRIDDNLIEDNSNPDNSPPTSLQHSDVTDEIPPSMEQIKTEFNEIQETPTKTINLDTTDSTEDKQVDQSVGNH